MKFKLYREMQGSAHVRVRVFVGPDDDHLALAGALIFSPKEATEFCLALKEASIRMSMQVEFVGGIQFNEKD